MSLLGIDYGEKYIGLALSQGTFAEGLKTVFKKEAVQEINRLIKEFSVEKCIIGMPSGKLQESVVRFSGELKKTVSVPVLFWDESLTTHTAQVTLRTTHASRKKRQEKEHATAAALVLESYLEYHTKL